MEQFLFCWLPTGAYCSTLTRQKEVIGLFFDRFDDDDDDDKSSLDSATSSWTQSKRRPRFLSTSFILSLMRNFLRGNIQGFLSGLEQDMIFTLIDALINSIPDCHARFSGLRPAMRAGKSILIGYARPEHQALPERKVLEEERRHVRFSSDFFRDQVGVSHPVAHNLILRVGSYLVRSFRSDRLDAIEHLSGLGQVSFAAENERGPSRLELAYDCYGSARLRANQPTSKQYQQRMC